MKRDHRETYMYYMYYMYTVYLGTEQVPKITKILNIPIADGQAVGPLITWKPLFTICIQ